LNFGAAPLVARLHPLLLRLPEIRLSVALVTRNRPHSLERCLRSWRAQSIVPSEIVISDDSDEAHADVVQKLANEFGCRYLSGPRRGLYANRNRASLACTGSYILSEDDDHTHPEDYVARLLELIATAPDRIWILPERHPGVENEALTCPTELHRSGHGCTPPDPSDCAAIADGCTIYPRGVFDSGLRYDEAYPFGALWYLWGQRLRHAGWRISFSDRTHVWHWCETEGRYHDRERLREMMEAGLYVLWVRALRLDRTLSSLFWAAFYSARRMLLPDSIIGFQMRTRLPLPRILRACVRACASPARVAPASRRPRPQTSAASQASAG
jgi:glycosyltransferase involved in cell wall biosynthesis